MSDGELYDVGSPASIAAHDQNQADALELLRASEQFVLATLDSEGHYALSVSATFSLVHHVEKHLNREAFRLLMAEIQAAADET